EAEKPGRQDNCRYSISVKYSVVIGSDSAERFPYFLPNLYRALPFGSVILRNRNREPSTYRSSNKRYGTFEDLYVDGSRLRLRKITEPNGNALYKFGRKYGKRSALSEPITTLYLTEIEYRQLSCLPGFSAS